MKLRKRMLKDLDADIRDHIARETQDNIDRGMSPDEARYAALRKFGNVTLAKEDTREIWVLRWLDELWQDLRFALRMMRKNPGFTAVAILTLALGIGANTAIFSLIDTVMLKMLPVQKPEELALIAMLSPSMHGGSEASISYPVWTQIRDQQDVFSGIFAFAGTRFDLSQGGESQFVDGLYVSGDFFNTLGVRPSAGRLLADDDDVRSCSGAAVLSYGFWQEHFGGARSAVGCALRLDNHSFQVVGVAPPGFFGMSVGSKFDVALPICAEAIIPLLGEADGAKFLDRPSARWLSIVGRTKPGVTPQKVNARLQVLAPGIFAATVSQDWRPEDQKDFLAGTLLAKPAGLGLSNLQNYNQPLRALMAVVGLVLLIACANIAGLMLARAAFRRKEFAVRLAIGASRGRLIRQVLTECILISSLGALFGILLAQWGCALLVRFISSSQDPVFLQLSLDGRVLAFTAGAALLTGLLFGLLPAFRSTRVSLTSAMKGVQAEESHGHSHFRSGRWTVSAQVALSLVILITSGLFLRSFMNLLHLDTGFDRRNVLLVETVFRHATVLPEERATLCRQILDRLRSLPGAISASESFVTPISGYMWGLDFYLEKGGGPSGDDANAYVNFVSPGYFATLHSALLAGRDFNAQDVAGAKPVAIISEMMAHRFFPHSTAVGQFLLTDDFMNNQPGKKTPPILVIAVVKDSKYGSLREDTISTLYLPIAQYRKLDDPPNFEIRTSADPASLARSAGEAIAAVNKNVSLTFVTLESQVDDSLRSEHLLATLSVFFGGLALLLAMIGLYGVLTFRVAQRRKEIGIRIALGAQKRSILRLVLRDVLVLLTAGIVAGIGISFWATRLMRTMLFDLNAHDSKTIILAVAILAGVSLLAAYLPARRAMRVDPMVALRSE